MNSKLLSLVVAVAAVLLGVTARAEPEARVVARVAGQGRFEARPVSARLDQAVELEVRLVAGRGLAPLPAGATVRWLRVVPRSQHRDPPARNGGLRIYANGTMFGPSHGRWLGHDTLEYDTVALEPGPGAAIAGAEGTLRLASADPTREHSPGTTWIAAEVTLPGQAGVTIRTPDGAAVEPLGISARVMRVSFRADDSFLGWLGTYFNVPYVFGSTGPQTDRYAGTDCADAMVGALRAAGRRGTPYTSVVGLVGLARPVTPTLVVERDGSVRDEGGTPAVVRWSATVRPGDLLVMDFADDAQGMLPRAWDHAAALVADGSGRSQADGALDGTDLVRHMSTQGLVDEPLSEMGRIRFRILRWR
jgi:hypothetical protein